MSTFSLKNYAILQTEPTFFGENVAGTDTIATANLLNFKTIGVVESGSGYTLEPNQVIKDSLGDEVVYSHKLNLELKVASALIDAQLAALDGKYLSIVLAPKAIKIPDDALDLSDADVVIPTTEKVIVFAPGTIKVTESVKMGTREINPLKLAVELVATTKADLKKEFGFTLI